MTARDAYEPGAMTERQIFSLAVRPNSFLWLISNSRKAGEYLMNIELSLKSMITGSITEVHCGDI